MVRSRKITHQSVMVRSKKLNHQSVMVRSQNNLPICYGKVSANNSPICYGEVSEYNFDKALNQSFMVALSKHAPSFRYDLSQKTQNSELIRCC